MPLATLKIVAAVVILCLSLLAGLASLRFVYKYQRLLTIADAAASGIFIGAAVFHIYPAALAGIERYGLMAPHLIVLGMIAASLLLLMLIDRIIDRNHPKESEAISITLLIITLGFHAFVTGVALGLSDTTTVFSIIFIAILAHKAFEMFAFIINLHRSLRSYPLVILLFCLFSLVTPAGILIGSAGDTLVSSKMDTLLTAVFNSFAAGTFLYIGIVHKHHFHFKQLDDSLHQYSKVVATIIGTLAMAILAIWV